MKPPFRISWAVLSVIVTLACISALPALDKAVDAEIIGALIAWGVGIWRVRRARVVAGSAGKARPASAVSQLRIRSSCTPAAVEPARSGASASVSGVREADPRFVEQCIRRCWRSIMREAAGNGGDALHLFFAVGGQPHGNSAIRRQTMTERPLSRPRQMP